MAFEFRWNLSTIPLPSFPLTKFRSDNCYLHPLLLFVCGAVKAEEIQLELPLEFRSHKQPVSRRVIFLFDLKIKKIQTGLTMTFAPNLAYLLLK